MSRRSMKKFLSAVAEADTPGRQPRFLMAALGALATAMTLVIALAALSAFQRDERQRMVEHTLNVQQAITRTLSLVQDAETGQRGFLLTADRTYLEPYENAVAAMAPQLEALDALVADNLHQVARAGQLRAETDERLRIIAQTLEQARQGRTDMAVSIIREGAGKASMDRIRAIAADMQREEADLLKLRAREDLASGDLLRTTLLAAAVVALVLGVFLFLAFRRFALALTASGRALAAKNAELEQEIAARKVTEAQLVQSQKMEAVGQLTGGLAHDFNNMLAVVLSAMSLMRRRIAAGDKDVTKFMDAAEDGARRAATLTSRLLAFARRQPLSPEPVDANRLVSGMSELLRRALGEQVSVETVLAGGLWQTTIDTSQLENSLLNLAVNARDAMPGGGRITIETGNTHLDDAYAARNAEVTPGQYVLIAVTDNGPGMLPEVIERAFEPFFTTKPVGKGTGLGLSQVYGFVKQSKGHIKIYSEPGQGTSVKIYLPRTRTEATEAKAAEAAAPAPAVREGAIILVVEDDEHVRNMTIAMLRELGYVVVHASNPSEALEKIRTLPRIDLLFTDVVMPEMNGRQLADKAIAMRPGLRVMFATGYTQNAIVHNGILDPGTDLLVKPFSLEQVSGKIAQALARDES
jgi:signal transduction histidine kinase/CheY-like chemotaxis protein